MCLISPLPKKMLPRDDPRIPPRHNQNNRPTSMQKLGIPLCK